MVTKLGRPSSFSFNVILTSDQFISKTSQIQFFLSFTFSGVNFPLILNRWILLATLHSFMGMYEWVLDIKSNIFVLLENKHPLKKLDFLILLVTE